ncbi:hypothetical protein [Actinomycetospora sp. CA-084318]|uniref:hypothetical protein n=1 Tax=Actinomycetospora sp. CA-084318 TaxID=3239892 RepID=UPI003D97F306
MRAVYRVLAYLLALEVIVQAAAIAWAIFGLTAWIEGGGVLDKAGMESESVVFDGVTGFMVHGMNGTLIVPALALLFLISSFFARFPGAIAWGAAAFVLTVVQVALGIFAHAIPALGMLHGAVALGLLVVALVAARRSSAADATREPAATGSHHAPVA